MSVMKVLKLVGLLFIAGFVGLNSPGSLSQSQGMELTVCPQGPPACDFSKIQKAIEAAPYGATIRIEEGTYIEHLLVKKSLRLIGAGQNKTTVKVEYIPIPGLSIFSDKR